MELYSVYHISDADADDDKFVGIFPLYSIQKLFPLHKYAVQRIKIELVVEERPSCDIYCYNAEWPGKLVFRLAPKTLSW